MLSRHISGFPWLVLQDAPPFMTTRYFSRAANTLKQLPPRPKVDEAHIEEAFLKGSGPGGQKIVCSKP